MADYAPLVLVGGVRQQLQAADRALANGIVARPITNLALVADSGQLVTIASGVDLQFGAATDEIGSSGDMIQVQNLLDKSAAEIITGAWQYNNNISFDTTARTIAGIANGNLVDKTAAETITLGVGDAWNFTSSGDNTSPNLTVQATAAQEVTTNRILFQVLASGGGNLFSVDTEGDVTIAGAETVSGASTVIGTANFHGDVNLGNGGDTINIGSGPTDDINFNGPITITIPDTENWTAIYIDNNDVTNDPIGFRVDGANVNTFIVDYDEVEVNTTAGPFDVNAGGAITLDAGASSNFTVSGNSAGNLLLGLTATNAGLGNSEVELNADVIDINSFAAAGDGVSITSSSDILVSTLSGAFSLFAGVEIDLTSMGGVIDMNAANIYMDASVGISLDSAAASNFTVAGAALTLATTTSGNVVINSAASVDVDSATDITMDASTGGISLDAFGNSNFSVASGNLTLNTGSGGNIVVNASNLLDIDCGGACTVDVGGGNLTMTVAGEFVFSDINKVTSTFAGDLKLTETAAEWDTYDSNFGEVSIFNALNQAYSAAGGAVQEVLLQSLTTTGLTTGQIAYFSANDTVLQADADSTLAVARAVGVYDGTAGEIVVQGRVDVVLDDAGAPAAGTPIYVSTTVGRGTATAPSTSGHYVTCIGYVVDNTGYLAAGDTVEVMLNVERPILL